MRLGKYVRLRLRSLRVANLRFRLWWRLYRAEKLLREADDLMQYYNVPRQIQRRIWQQFRNRPASVLKMLNDLLTGIRV